MNRFVISDTHFSHTNSWEKFKRPDGSPLRPFTSTEEMDEAMVERWNKVVSPKDTVYHCGDVSINKRGLEYVRRLNGRKILIKGNHDTHKDQLYYDVGFEQLHGVRVFNQWIMSHVPLHADSVTERFRVNVHGHYHANEVMLDEEIDPRYLCVSVEHTDYAPISFEEVEARIQKRWADTNYTPVAKAWGNGSGPA